MSVIEQMKEFQDRNRNEVRSSPATGYRGLGFEEEANATLGICSLVNPILVHS